MTKNHDTVATEKEPTAAEQVRGYVNRYINLEREKKAISETQKDLLKKAKDDGFDVKAIKDVIRLQTADKEEIEKHNELVAIYERAVNGEQIVFEKIGGQQHPAEVDF